MLAFIGGEVSRRAEDPQEDLLTELLFMELEEFPEANITPQVVIGITNLLIVQGTIQFSLGILAEAALSYVGLGVQPPTPSWGRMLADSQTLISLAPHMALFPGFAIILTVLGLNLAGDGLRDLLDPRIRRTAR